MGEKAPALEDLSNCIISGLTFNSNFKALLTNLYSDPIEESVRNYLKAIEDVLKNPDYPPASKFYCVLLLLKITEFENEGLDVFINELARAKNLLNKLFQDAQFDKDKLFSDKGNKFFTKTPKLEEKIIGNNYVRLALEIIKFWAETYGSSSKKDLGHVFFIMFTSLGKMLQFPEGYHYVCKDYEITDDFHLKQDFGTEGQVVDQAAINIKAFMQVSSCISSGTEYKLNSKVIFDSLAENSAVYSDSLLDTIAEILESKDYAPKSKFYALYLLVQVTETHNKVFMTRFSHRKNLLTKFAQVVLIDATSKERGGRLFPEIVNTPDAVIGKNYITLLVEAIKYWDVSFGSDDINSPFNAFRTLDSSIWEFVRVPKDYFYVGQNLDPEGGVMGKSLSIIEFPPMILEEPLSSQNHQETFDPQHATDHVNHSVASVSGFKENFKVIAETLQLYSKEYIDLFLKRILEIISTLEEPPLSHFLAVYLLGKTTELGNEALMLAVEKHKELLNKLYFDAKFDSDVDNPEKGTTFFVGDGEEEEAPPRTRLLGNAYVNLVLELLLFWSQAYGGENKNSPGLIFHNMISKLSQKKVHFPQRSVYLGKDINTVLAELDEKVKSREEKVVFKEVVPTGKEEVTQQREIQENRTTSKNGAGQSEAIEESLERLREVKESLQKFLEKNRTESSDINNTIETLVGQMNELYFEELEPLLSELPDKTRLYEEGEVNDKINEQYAKYRAQKISYTEFRNSIFKALKVDNNIESPPKKTVIQEPNKQEDSSQKPPRPQQQKQQLPENRELGSSAKKEGRESRLRGSESARKGDNSFHEEKSLSSRGFDAAQLGASRRKIPEEKLRSSLMEIERGINLSRVKASDLSQIEESIKKSYIRADKKPPVFEPLDELKKKEMLEQEIARLKKEKLNLSSSFMKSQFLQFSPGSQKGEGEYNRQEEEIRDLGRRGSEPSRGLERQDELVNQEAAKEYQQMVEDLQRKVEQANQELQKKVYEIESLKKASQDTNTNGEEVKRMKEENKVLKGKLEETRSQLQQMRTSSVERERASNKEKAASHRENREVFNSRNGEPAPKRERNPELFEYKSPRGELQQQRQEELLAPKLNQAKIQKTEVVYGRGSTTMHSGGSNANNMNQKPTSIRSAVYDTQEKSELVMKQVTPRETQKTIQFGGPGEERNLSSVVGAEGRLSQKRPTVNTVNGDHPPHHSTPEKGHAVGELEEHFETPKSQFSRGMGDNGSEISWVMSTKQQEIIEAPAGKLVEQDYPFLNRLKKELGRAPNPQELVNYKLNCFKNKTVLFENNYVQVGATSALLTDPYYQRRLLKTVLYFANRSPDYLDDFTLSLGSDNGQTHVLKPEVVQSSIEPGKQAKQQIISLIQNIPFESTQLMGSFSFRHNTMQFGFYLPNVVTKFMEFKYIDLESFERRWNLNAKQILKSNTVNLDTNLVKSGHDFKKYFNYLLDLKIMDEYDYIQGKKSLDFGGIFELDLLGIEYMLKISVLPGRKVIFQIIADPKDYEVAKFILGTLVFLFQA